MHHQLLGAATAERGCGDSTHTTCEHQRTPLPAPERHMWLLLLPLASAAMMNKREVDNRPPRRTASWDVRTWRKLDSKALFSFDHQAGSLCWLRGRNVMCRHRCTAVSCSAATRYVVLDTGTYCAPCGGSVEVACETVQPRTAAVRILSVLARSHTVCTTHIHPPTPATSHSHAFKGS